LKSAAIISATGLAALLSISSASYATDVQVGISSFYSTGARVATGARYLPDAMTAAHRTLPLGATIHVTNLYTGRSATLVVNDRGPFIKGRILDLSRGSARALQVTGLAKVRIDVVTYGRHQPLTPKFQAQALAKLEKITDLRRNTMKAESVE
jgi:peptidoglycan lytic transglycosylase